MFRPGRSRVGLGSLDPHSPGIPHGAGHGARIPLGLLQAAFRRAPPALRGEGFSTEVVAVLQKQGRCWGIETFLFRNKSANGGRGVKGEEFSCSPGTPGPTFRHTSCEKYQEIKSARFETNFFPKAPGAGSGKPRVSRACWRQPSPLLGLQPEQRRAQVAAGAALEAEKRCSSPSVPAALPRAWGCTKQTGKKKKGFV